MNSEKLIAIVSPDKIPGSPSLDQIFGANDGRNEFNVSTEEADREMKRKLQQPESGGGLSRACRHNEHRCRACWVQS